MALSAANTTLQSRREDLSNGAELRIPVKAANTVWQGGFYALVAGELAVPTGAEAGIGFAEGNGAAGEYVYIRNGDIKLLPLTNGHLASNLEALVYATSDNVFTLTPQTTIVGRLVNNGPTNYAWVHVNLGVAI